MDFIKNVHKYVKKTFCKNRKMFHACVALFVYEIKSSVWGVTLMWNCIIYTFLQLTVFFKQNLMLKKLENILLLCPKIKCSNGWALFLKWTGEITKK